MEILPGTGAEMAATALPDLLPQPGIYRKPASPGRHEKRNTEYLLLSVSQILSIIQANFMPQQ